MSGITPFVLCVWLISLSIKSSRFICVKNIILKLEKTHLALVLASNSSCTMLYVLKFVLHFYLLI